MRGRFLATLTAVALALTAAGCGDNAAGSGSSGGLPDGEIVLGSIEPLSGVYGPTGTSYKTLLDVAVEHINAAGGIAGRKIRIEHFDDKSDPTTALAGARHFVDIKVAGVIGFGLGPSKDQTLPFFNKYKIPVINNNANQFLYDIEKQPYFFGVGPTDRQIVKGWIAFAKAKGYNNLAGLSDGQQFAEELAQFSEEETKATDLTWTGKVSYSPTAVDITTQLRQLKETGAQVIITGALTNVPRIFSGLDQIGWNPPIITTGAIQLYPPNTLGKSAPVTYAYCTDYLTRGAEIPAEMKALLAKARARLGEQGSVLTVIVFYDILSLFAKAIQEANSIEGTAVKAALEKITNFTSINPVNKIGFSATSHAGFQQDVKVCGVQEKGEYGLPYLAD